MSSKNEKGGETKTPSAAGSAALTKPEAGFVTPTNDMMSSTPNYAPPYKGFTRLSRFRGRSDIPPAIPRQNLARLLTDTDSSSHTWNEEESSLVLENQTNHEWNPDESIPEENSAQTEVATLSPQNNIEISQDDMSLDDSTISDDRDN